MPTTKDTPVNKSDYKRFTSDDFVLQSDRNNDPGFEMDLLEAQAQRPKYLKCSCGEFRTNHPRVVKCAKIAFFMLPITVAFAYILWDKIPLITALADQMWNPDVMQHFEIGTVVHTSDYPEEPAWIVYRGYSDRKFWYHVSRADSTPMTNDDPKMQKYNAKDLTIIGELPIPSVEYMEQDAEVKLGKAPVRDHPGEPHPLHLLTYDIDCRSQLFYSHSKYGQTVRTMLWNSQYLHKYDVIGFQEQHEVDQIATDLKDFHEEYWLYVPPTGARPGDYTPILMTSGNIIVSKHEILAQHYHIFHHVGYLRIQSSGVAFTLLKTPGKHSFVFNTKLEEDIMLQRDIPLHLQWMLSDVEVNIDKLRQTQMMEVYNFIRAMCKYHGFKKETDRIILMGNFNVDAMFEEGHDPQNFNLISRAVDDLFKDFGLTTVTQPNRAPTFPIDLGYFIDRSFSQIFIGEFTNPLKSVSVGNAQLMDFEVSHSESGLVCNKDMLCHRDNHHMQIAGDFRHVGKTVSQHRGVSLTVSERAGRP